MVLLGLGSNLKSSFGDRFYNLDLAVLELSKFELKIKKKSSYYETPSFPNKNNPKFINIIIEIETPLKPENLASKILEVEKFLGRKRFKKNDPRTCDIDIIDFNQQVLDFEHKGSTFKVPHEKLIYRNFVLFPLKEIKPDWKHPESNIKIDDLIDRLSDEDKNSILKINKN